MPSYKLEYTNEGKILNTEYSHHEFKRPNESLLKKALLFILHQNNINSTEKAEIRIYKNGEISNVVKIAPLKKQLIKRMDHINTASQAIAQAADTAGKTPRQILPVLLSLATIHYRKRKPLKNGHK